MTREVGNTFNHPESVQQAWKIAERNILLRELSRLEAVKEKVRQRITELDKQIR